MKLKTILLTGLLVGTLDGVAAILLYLIKGGNKVEIVFKFIASGVFGKAAFSGGAEMMLFGIVFHYIIATGWTLLFFLLYPKILPSWKNKYLSGILYGIFVWLMMNKVVVPLSNTPSINQSLSGNIVGILIIIIAVGLPVSIIYHKTTDQRD